MIDGEIIDDENTQYADAHYEADIAYYCKVYDETLAALVGGSVKEPGKQEHCQAGEDARAELAVRIARFDKEGRIDALEAAEHIIMRYFTGPDSGPGESPAKYADLYAGLLSLSPSSN